jgi:hypothetical protein
MTAKADLISVSNLSTFGTWKDLTNDLRAIAQISVTMGDNEVNNGNVVLNGDLTLAPSKVLKIDTITSTDNVNLVTINKNLVRVNGIGSVLQINSLNDVSDNTTASKLSFSKGTAQVESFYITTNANHTELEIGTSSKRFSISSGGVINSSESQGSVTIHSDMLTSALEGKNIGQSQPALGKFTKLECTGSGGNGIVDNVAIGTNIPSTIKGTRIDIDPDPDDNLSDGQINALTGLIDNTAIGSNIPRSGSFTSISTTTGVTGSGGTLGFGDVYNQAGSVKVVDTVNRVFNGRATEVDNSAVITVMDAIYPVGGIYITTLASSPNTILNWPAGSGEGQSTWERFAEGKTLLGYDTGVTISDIQYSTASGGYWHIGVSDASRFLETEEIQINVGGTTITEHNATITVGHVAKVISKNGNVLKVELEGNPTPASSGVGVPFTVPNNAVAVHKNFGTGGAFGGSTAQAIDAEHVPDHVHDNKAWHGEQFYLYNDANSPTSLFGTSRAQGPTGGSDAHLYQYSGGVYGYETGSGIEQVDVGKPHNNMSAFVTTYMWKRTA